MKFNILQNAKFLCMGAKTKLVDCAPTIWTVVGCLSLVGGTVVACLRTGNMDEIKQRRDDILDLYEKEFNEKKITEKEYHRQMGHAYRSWAWDIAVNYAPAAFLEALGIFSVFKGHTMVLGRLAATSGLLAESLKRENFLERRIREVYGDEAYEQLVNGEAVIVEKDGTETTVAEKYGDIPKELSFIWHEGMGDFCPDDNAMNWNIVSSIQNYFNMSASHYGNYVPINAVLDIFGAGDIARPEYDKATIGYPNTKLMLKLGYSLKEIEKHYSLKLKVEELPFKATDSPGRAPDLKITFVNPPMPCSELMIKAGVRAA